jgi:hypothetical protein
LNVDRVAVVAEAAQQCLGHGRLPRKFGHSS